MEMTLTNLNYKSYSQNELTETFANHSTLGAIIKVLEDNAKVDGQVICEIKINGEILSEDDEAKFQNMPVSEIKDLFVSTQAPHDLLTDSVASCNEYLDRLFQAIERDAHLFRGADMAKAHQFHNSCLEGTQWFIKMMELLKGAVEASSKATSLSAWKATEKELEGTLTEILDAFEKKNFILMADLMEYDLLHNLQKWREHLQELKTAIGEPQNTVG